MLRVKYDIDFKTCNGQVLNWFQPIDDEARFQQMMHDRGIIWDKNLDHYDLLVKHTGNWNWREDEPHVILYGHDEASIIDGFRHNALYNSRVKLILAPNTYRDHADHNDPHFDFSTFGTMIYNHTPIERLPHNQYPVCPQLIRDLSVVEKKVLPFGSMMWTRFYGYKSGSPSIDKKYIDINLLGRISNYTKWSTVEHRRACHSAVEKLPSSLVKLTAGRTALDTGEHFESLRRSKIVLSPWGFGETTGRDHQGLQAGCVVIKPNTSHIRTEPDLYDGRYKNLVYCRPDYSDLPELVERILDEWREWRPIIEQNQKIVWDLGNSDYMLVDQLAAHLHRAVNL